MTGKPRARGYMPSATCVSSLAGLPELGNGGGEMSWKQRMNASYVDTQWNQQEMRSRRSENNGVRVKRNDIDHNVATRRLRVVEAVYPFVEHRGAYGSSLVVTVRQNATR